MAANKSPQQHEQQKQQQQQHHRQQQHLQIQFQFWWRSPCLLIVVLGLLSMLAGNCVNGQIDGYIAGEDYPAYDAVPKGLAFNCQGRQPGYYADTETRCQVWHWCLHSGHQYSFLCPNGTVFNQAVRVCDWWSNVNCAGSEQLYQNNDELYRIPEKQQSTNPQSSYSSSQQQQQQEQPQQKQQHKSSKNSERKSKPSSSSKPNRLSHSDRESNRNQTRTRNRTHSNSPHQGKKKNPNNSNSNTQNTHNNSRGKQRYNTNKFENDAELKDYKSKIKNKYNIDYDHSLDEEYEIIEAIE
ncbi:hypothetical protein KR059_004001 [Drosophila kikkawai]|nr:hypothetical protein KR059_004001 [Drosophila kikkawai]